MRRTLFRTILCALVVAPAALADSRMGVVASGLDNPREVCVTNRSRQAGEGEVLRLR